MSCYNPLHAFTVGHQENGKKIVKICSNTVFGLLKQGSGYSYLPKNSKYLLASNQNYEPIPCGRCIGCRLDYSSRWADRCMLELPYHEVSYFMTMSYDDNNIPLSSVVDESTGELIDHQTLVKRDLQLFHKRLRKYGFKFNYLASGEYGTKTARPHYHAIYFGMDVKDLIFYKQTSQGHDLYNSPTIDSIWKNGYVVIGNVSWNTCAYVSRYVVEKQFGVDKKVYEEKNIEPPFMLMSRRPSIGRTYFDDNKDKLFNYDNIVVSTEEGGKKINIPKYFHYLLEKTDTDMYNRLKEKTRVSAQEGKKVKEAQTDLDYYELLSVEERTKIAKTNILKEGRKL